MTNFLHNRIAGLDAIHELMWIGAADPAATPANDVQPHQFWLNTTGGARLDNGAILNERNAGNTAWTVRADFSGGLGGIPLSLFDALGDLIYGSADNTAAKLSGSITAVRKFLRQLGTGSVSAAPAWDTIAENDVGASTNDAGNTGTAITIDWSVARTQKVTATGNATITHSNMVAGIVYTLEYHTGAGSFTATFAATNWAGGAAPTLTATATKLDIFTFYKTIGGTIEGAIFGQSFTP